MRTPPDARSNPLASGRNAARPKGASPVTIEIIPVMIESIAIIVTASGLDESLSVFNHFWLISNNIKST
jgi:hypothetical protein